MNKAFIISIFTLFALNASAQCAQDYVGKYGVKYCGDPDTITSYTFTASVSLINPSKILISNFHGVPLGTICGVEDTIVVDLQCSADSLSLQRVWYPICPGNPGALDYSGAGHLYADSMIINYLQSNPVGQQNICLVYKLGLYTSLNDRLKESKFIEVSPNPTFGQIKIETELIIKELTIIDLTGKELMTFEGNLKTIDVSELPNGIYSIRFVTKNNISTKKFVKY